MAEEGRGDVRMWAEGQGIASTHRGDGCWAFGGIVGDGAGKE